MKEWNQKSVLLWCYSAMPILSVSFVSGWWSKHFKSALEYIPNFPINDPAEIVRIHKPDQRSIYHISIVTQRYSLALNGASLAAANRDKKYLRICGEIKKSQQTRHAHSVTPWNCEVQTTVDHHPRMDTNMKIMIERIRILNQQTRTE